MEIAQIMPVIIVLSLLNERRAQQFITVVINSNINQYFNNIIASTSLKFLYKIIFI